MNITLKGERPISWNSLYDGKRHWSYRADEAERVHTLVSLSIRKSLFTSPVDITLTAYFKNRPLDADNICAKLYIDGLKGRVIADDSPQWVRSVKTVSLVDKENPRLVIFIEEATNVE